jgi:selenide,water dikinase
MIYFDPQTSGGLLICVKNEEAEALLADLHERGVEQSAIIGEVVDDPADKIVIT